jgi:hypothetical protein
MTTPTPDPADAPHVVKRVLSRLVIDPTSGCLNWTASTQSGGYGQTMVNRRNYYTHRLMYRWFVGPIPAGHQLDHLCRNRRCAAPAHLEPVSHRENALRSPLVTGLRAKCRKGHPLDASNLWVEASGTRRCLICYTATQKRARDRRQAAAVAA